jgi:predicted ATPase
MLTNLKIRGFKSLRDVNIDLPRMSVFFGPNAAGKSNILDAVQTLSRVATSRTLSDALTDPSGNHLLRGFPIEAFALPQGGLPELLQSKDAAFELDARLNVKTETYRYRIEVAIHPSSGALSVQDEYLTTLDRSGNPKGQARIEKQDGELTLRARAHPGRPRREKLGLNYALISDARLGGAEYRVIETCRREFDDWRTYYLDPRVAMRSAKPPAEVDDIGVLGENIAPFLYRLHSEHPKSFEALDRTLSALIPSIEQLNVDLDVKRGTLDIVVRQDGIDFSSRVLSEGTLRVIALCSIAVNPWRSSLIAFEEPENGVHPRRIELIADLLTSLIERDPPIQVIITTHSPTFCNSILRAARDKPSDVGLFQVNRSRTGSQLSRFDTAGPLFDKRDVLDALNTASDDGIFEKLLMRGLIDA